MTKSINSDHLELETERRILAYKEQGWSPDDIADQMQINVQTVKAVIKRGIPIVRYVRQDGAEVSLAPQVWSRGKPKVTRCECCGAFISTNYCLRCAVAKHPDVRA